MLLATRFYRNALGALFFLALLLPLAGRAQAPAWQLAINPSHTNGSSSQIISVVTDAFGDVYVAGYYQGSITVGSTTLNSAGLSDAFVAKWNTAGSSFVWAQSMGGGGSDFVTGIAVNGARIYLTGTYSNTAQFGTLGLTSTGAADVFVAKLTDIGPTATWNWVQSNGGPGADAVRGIALSGANVYVTGSFAGQATFGTSILTSNGPTDAFVMRLTDTGPAATFNWVQPLGGPGNETPTGVAATGTNVYITGFYSGNTVFGTITLPTVGNNDIFVARITDFTTAPQVAWAQRAGGPNDDYAVSIAANGTSVYVSGDFTNTATFGASSYTSAGSYDAFLSKLTDTGTAATFTWTLAAGGPGDEYGYATTVRGNLVYLAGTFTGSSVFGTVPVTSAGIFDVFVSRVMDLGAYPVLNWVQRAGSTNSDGANTVAVGLNNKVWVGGNVGPGAAFGTTMLNTGTISGAGFLANLTDIVLATAAAQPMPGLAVYPTVAHDRATIAVPAVAGTSIATLTLLDAVGHAVRAVAVALPATGLRHELDLAGLAPGVYAVRVNAGPQAATCRLVVE